MSNLVKEIEKRIETIILRNNTVKMERGRRREAGTESKPENKSDFKIL